MESCIQMGQLVRRAETPGKRSQELIWSLPGKTPLHHRLAKIAQTLEGCQCNIPWDPEPIISSSLEHPQLSERHPPLIQRASGLKGGHQRDVRACREGNEVQDKGPFAICEENVTFS